MIILTEYETGHMKRPVDGEANFWNLVDAALMGIPGSVVLPDVARKYDIEIADLNRLYNQLNRELNNLTDEGISLANAKSEIKELLYQAGPLGAIRADLSEKYKKVSSDIEDNRKAQQSKVRKIEQTGNRLASKQQAAARSSTLGGAISSGDV